MLAGKQIKATLKNIVKKILFSTPMRTQNVTMGQNAAKIDFLNFSYHLSYTLVDLIC